MVLKKSNSHFNSGATQRFTNRGAMIRCLNFLPQEETISIFLSGHEEQSQENVSIFQKALTLIYDVLESHGPDLPLFYDRDGKVKRQMVFNTFSYYANSRQRGCVSIEEKVKQLMNTDVLEQLADKCDVEIKIKKCFVQGQNNVYRNVNILSWKLSDKNLNQSGSREDNLKKCRNSKQSIRGVQRLKRPPTKKKWYMYIDEDEQDAEPITSRNILIEIQETHAKDARLVRGINAFFRKWKTLNDTAARWKRKSYVNGRRSFFRDYNSITLLAYDKEAVLEPYEQEEIFEDFISSDDFVENSEKTHNANEICNRLDSHTMSLDSYMTPSVYIKLDHQHSSKSNSEKCVSLNSASSEKVRRYPKGSCIFINETTKDAYDSDVDSSIEINSSFTLDDKIDNKIQMEKYENQTKSDDFLVDLTSNITDFISSFVPLQLILPSEYMQLLLNYQTDWNEKYQIDDCDVTFGNCYPPTFLLKVDTKKNIHACNWCLIGKAVGAFNDQPDMPRWQIKMMDMDTCDCNGNQDIIDGFYRDIFTKFPNKITLLNLAKVFTKSVQCELSSKDEFKYTKKSSVKKPLHIWKSPWSKLKHFFPHYTNTKSIEEALETMRDEPSNTNSPDSSNSLQTNGSENTLLFAKKSLSQCNICFLPCDFSHIGDNQALGLASCGHMFCGNCWSYHINISLRSGDPICCMDSDCKEELNETVLRCLAPGYIVNKWLQRIHDKEIEKNPLCKWCPNSRCEKLAILKNISEKINHFGLLVVCDCQIPWCFSCQKEPHWPASCEQTEVFHKLLAKTDQDLDNPQSKIQFIVEMKRCPKCQYPLEKNKGSPFMRCYMCQFNFCWECLRPVHHNIYFCKPKNNHISFTLENRKVPYLPKKFFPDFLEMNKKRRDMDANKRKLASWLQRINHCYNLECHRLPRPWSGISNRVWKDSIRIAEITIDFFHETYAVLESLYVLMSFVNINKEKPKRSINQILNRYSLKANCLLFSLSRLEEKILYKSLSQIGKQIATAEILVKCGRKQISQIKGSIHILQSLSKSVDPSEVANMDVLKYFRYK